MSSNEINGANDTEMVRAEQIVKRFGPLTVLNGVDLSVKRGQVVVIIGPSGSGKTTLLRCLNHLEKIDGGRIYIDGQLLGYRERKGQLVEDREVTIARLRAQIGFVFQRFNLFPHKTALENVSEAPIHVLGQSKQEVNERARALLAKVGLGDKLHSYPHKLSGGQQQRVAIARALSNEPSLLLADEPTGNLDTRTSIDIMGVFQKLNDLGMTIVMVTHELDIAQYTKRMVVMRDGKLVSDTAVSKRLNAGAELRRLQEEEKAAHLQG
jgi:polar amino acid transport system ATP-binding protein